MPPFAANLVHLASSAASMITSNLETVPKPVEERKREGALVGVVLFFEAEAKSR
jgi:hypothetical protein